MKFITEITEKDLIEGFRLYIKSSGAYKKQVQKRILLSLVYAIIYIFLISLFSDLLNTSYLYSYIVIVILLSMYGLTNIEKRLIKEFKNQMNSGDNKAIIGSINVELTENELIYSSAYIEWKFKWSVFYEVYQNENYWVLLYSSRQFLLLPKNHLESNIEEDKILEFINAHVSK